MRVVSITDHDVRRSRDAINESLANLARLLQVEVAKINADVKRLQEDVERLKQGGGHPRISGYEAKEND